MDVLKLKSDPRLPPAPEPTPFDYGLAVAKAAAIAFPFFGAGVTLVDLVTAPLRGKRFSDWCEEIRLLSRRHCGASVSATGAKKFAFASTT